MTSNPGFPNLTIVPIPVPTSLDAEDAWGVHAIAEINREHEISLLGHDDLAYSALERMIALQNQKYERKFRFAALATPADAGQPSRVLGVTGVDLPTAGNTHLGAVTVVVREAHRRRGVGMALARAVLDLVLADGRTGGVHRHLRHVGTTC
jgi:GNAT superfamily N-acetyltransferase